MVRGLSPGVVVCSSSLSVCLLRCELVFRFMTDCGDSRGWWSGACPGTFISGTGPIGQVSGEKRAGNLNFARFCTVWRAMFGSGFWWVVAHWVLPGSDQVLPGCDQVLPGRDQVLPGHYKVLPGHDQVLPGHDQVLPGRDQVLPGCDQVLPGRDQVLPCGDQVLPRGE